MLAMRTGSSANMGRGASGVLGKGISVFIAIYNPMARGPLQFYVSPTSLYSDSQLGDLV